MQRLWYLASLAAVLPAAAAQQRTAAPLEEQRPAAARAPLVPPASALDAVSQRPDPALRTPGVNGGSPIAYEALLDDEVPLPIPAKFAATPQGDRMIAPASGDPYFLGFIAGPYYPPAGERIDPLLLANVQAAYGDGRPTQETYAFVMFEKRITEARVEALKAQGARVIEFHPHNCLKIALPIFSIDTIAANPDVRWIGVARPQQKLHPRLVQVLAQARPGQLLPVYINLFDSDLCGNSVIESLGSVTHLTNGVIEPGDPTALPKRTQSNGWQQLRLQELGVEVLEYVEGIRAFRARIVPEQLENLVGLDFVQFVERDEAVALEHDFSTPLIGSDNTRPYASGGTNFVATAGQVDSGFDFGHWDLNHTNGVGWDLSGSASGAWADGCEHGSHVAGSYLGNGWAGEPELIGNAPGLGWGGAGRFYNIKIFNDSCIDGGASMATYLGLLHSSYFDGVSTTQRPMVINNSYGQNPGGGTFSGTEANARLIDDEVYFYVQDYVFSSGNYGAGKIGNPACSKNALTVGSVQAYTHPGFGAVGDLAWDSSTGPCGDGRWKPNVVAPGVNILSVDAGSTTGHAYKSGTSMAAPHVAGVIAGLVDNYSFLRYMPARTDSLVMASAVTRNNQVLTTSGETHLRQFGTGRVDATKAMWGSGDSGWINWGFFMSSNTYGYADFTVNPGCTRLVVVMHYAESQASSGATVALKNNWDMYLDVAPFDPNFNTGDFYAHISSVDNTEIRILDYPATGAWRWKTWPASTTTGCDMGVTVYAFYGDMTPDLTVTTTQDKYYAKVGEEVNVTGWVYNPSGVAAGVSIAENSGTSLIDSFRSLADGTLASFKDNYPSYGSTVTLGDMFPGTWKGNIWKTAWYSEGVKNFGVSSSSDNAVNQSANTQVVIDSTPPSDVTGLHSTTHTPFVWSNDWNLSVAWNAASDNLAGVAGYSITLASGAPSIPPPAHNWYQTYYDSFGLPSTTAAGYYFSVRAVDYAGNASANTAILGPIRIDTDLPTEPSNVLSTSHAPGVETCNAIISVQWDNGTDAHSGVMGYALAFDNNPGTDLTGAPLTSIGTGTTSFNQYVGSTSSNWYFHIATADVAGNYSATVTSGPYKTSVTPQIYCSGKLNSLGCLPYMSWSGNASASASSGFTIEGNDVRNNKSGLLFYSVSGTAGLPYQGGTLCVKSPIKRTPSVSSGGSPAGQDCSGVYSIDMNAFAAGALGGTPLPALQVVGTNVYCQWWGRDPGFPAPDNTTLSGGLHYVVCN